MINLTEKIFFGIYMTFLITLLVLVIVETFTPKTYIFRDEVSGEYLRVEDDYSISSAKAKAYTIAYEDSHLVLHKILDK